MVEDVLGTVHWRHGVQVQGVLDTRFVGHIESFRIVRPERNAEVLILFLVEIGPDRRYPAGKRCGHIDKADLHVRVLLPHLRVMRLADLPVLAEGRIDREHRHFRVVEMIEGELLAVRRPPESAVAGGTAQDFLVVHPGSVTVHHRLRSVEGQAAFLPVGNRDHIEVIGTRESQHRGIRRIREIHGAFRLQREIGELLRGLHAGHLRSLGHHQLEAGVVGVHSVVRERHLLVAQPLIRIGHPVELLRECTASQRRERQGKD